MGDLSSPNTTISVNAQYNVFHNSGDAWVLIFMKFVTTLVKSKVFANCH